MVWNVRVSSFEFLEHGWEELKKSFFSLKHKGTIVFFYTELHGEFLDILYVEESFTEGAALELERR